MTENNMRLIKILLYAGFAVALGVVAAVAQNTFGPSTDNTPPTDSVKIFALADLQSKIKGDQAGRLLEGQELFSLNLLHRTTEPATVHGDVVDLYIVQEGSATLESGGTMLSPKPAGRTGDQTGTGISGGKTQVIKKGDVVFIPPGVAHRFTGGDIWYLNAHFPGKKK
jgi:mannose-6-phosphate isomerase-like protein (cupin superfamily)